MPCSSRSPGTWARSWPPPSSKPTRSDEEAVFAQRRRVARLDERAALGWSLAADDAVACQRTPSARAHQRPRPQERVDRRR